MKKIILMMLVFSVSFLFAAPRTFEPEKYDIGEDLEKNEESWIQSSVDFVQEHKDTGFRYISPERKKGSAPNSDKTIQPRATMRKPSLAVSLSVFGFIHT